jgi:hypothetical protein
VNAATQSGNGGIAAAELVTLTGFGIGPDAGVSYQPDAQGNVPAETGGVQVMFDGAPAPVLYAQSRQINTIAPAGPHHRRDDERDSHLQQPAIRSCDGVGHVRQPGNFPPARRPILAGRGDESGLDAEWSHESGRAGIDRHGVGNRVWRDVAGMHSGWSERSGGGAA